MYPNSKRIRVPSNTHPSQLYGDSSSAALSDTEEDDEVFYSAQGTPASRPQSIRASIRNFAGSYSRASILYVADAISIQDHQQPQNDEEQQLLYKTGTTDSFASTGDKTGLVYRTFSQRTGDHNSITYHGQFEPLSRHTTVGSIISRQLSNMPPPPEILVNDMKLDNVIQAQQQQPPKSNFLQSVFNAVNVLVGVGILALPLSFRLAGWLYGSLIFLFCCMATNYTAKVIVKCLSHTSSSSTEATTEGGEDQQQQHEEQQHDIHDGGGTYGDMGQIAFGDKGRTLISTIFVIELITIGVAMIVLLGDGIQTLFPQLELLTTRIISFCVLTPTIFLPIKQLAYTSLIGIIACISLVIIVLYDGLSKSVKPGSLFDPMETEIIPFNISNLPLSFGLIMSGFAGHAVFPSIYRDMENPKKYNAMVNITYVITAITYVFMGIVGYLMFGQEALQEITQNLALVEEYSQALNRFAIWMLVLTPLAKYGLMMQPLNLSWELVLFKNSLVETWIKLDHNDTITWRRNGLTILGRIFVTASLVYIALVFPGFDKVMSLLGALFSFTISIILPLICHLQLFKDKLSVAETTLNWFILVVAILMASFGTIWSFRPSEL